MEQIKKLSRTDILRDVVVSLEGLNQLSKLVAKVQSGEKGFDSTSPMIIERIRRVASILARIQRLI